MKNIILPKLTFLSLFIFWILNGSAQENNYQTVISKDALKVKTSGKSGETAKNDGVSLKSQNKTFRIAKSSKTNITIAGSNLTPYQPTDWDDKIVLSTVTGTHTSASTIYNNQTIYLDWALTNDGTSDITQTFRVELYFDGLLSDEIDVQGLKAGYYISASDWAYLPFSAGSHTFKIVADAGNTVAETNENDNEYSRIKTITYTVPCVNLTPIQPTGWDDKLVLSTVIGTSTSASTIYSNEIIYADWAVRNIGGCGTTVTFNVNIYVDGALQNSFAVQGLDYGSRISVFDRQIGPLPAGSHTFKVVCDANNVVNEINETDNEYTRLFTISAATTGVEALENLTAIKIYPNPVSDKLVIEYKGNNEMINFEIMNSAGQIINSGELLERTIVNTTNFMPGIYLIKFDDKKISGTKRVIKK